MINSQTDRGIAVAQSPTQRSRVTNGRSLFSFEKQATCAILGPDGSRTYSPCTSMTSEVPAPSAKLSARSVAALRCSRSSLSGCSTFATDTARERDLDTYVRASGNLRRLLEAIGLHRKMKNVTTLGDLLREDLDRQRREAQPSNISHRLHDIQAASRGHPLHEMRRGLSG